MLLLFASSDDEEDVLMIENASTAKFEHVK